jgi:hypothetical protein
MPRTINRENIFWAEEDVQYAQNILKTLGDLLGSVSMSLAAERLDNTLVVLHKIKKEREDEGLQP